MNEDGDSDDSTIYQLPTNSTLNCPSSSSDVFLEATNNEADDNIFYISCDQFVDADLNAKDTFIFLSGVLVRVERYLRKLEQDGLSKNHSNWLISNVNLVKTALQNLELDLNHSSKVLPKLKNEKKQLKSKDNLAASKSSDSDLVPKQETNRHVNTSNKSSALSPRKAKLNHASSLPLASTKTRPKTNVKPVTRSGRKSMPALMPSDMEAEVTIASTSHNDVSKRSLRTNPRRVSKPMTLVLSKSLAKSLTKSELKKCVADSDARSILTKIQVVSANNDKAKNKTAKRQSLESAFSKKKIVTSTPVSKQTTNKRHAVSLDGGLNKRAKKNVNVAGETSNCCNSTLKKKLYNEDEWIRTLNVTQTQKS